MFEMKPCARCNEKEAINVMLPLAELDESGRVLYPNETKDQSIQVPVSLCFKCLSFAHEGWINVCKNPSKEGLILLEIGDKESEFGLTFFENRYRQGELTKDIEESLLRENKTRRDIKKQKMKNAPLRIAIIVEEVFNEFLKGQQEVNK